MARCCANLAKLNSNTIETMTDLDIWRCAKLLLKRFGGKAVFIATRRSDALLDQGDTNGCTTWIQITCAITDLERKQAGGNTLH